MVCWCFADALRSDFSIADRATDGEALQAASTAPFLGLAHDLAEGLGETGARSARGRREERREQKKEKKQQKEQRREARREKTRQRQSKSKLTPRRASQERACAHVLSQSLVTGVECSSVGGALDPAAV